MIKEAADPECSMSVELGLQVVANYAFGRWLIHRSCLEWAIGRGDVPKTSFLESCSVTFNSCRLLITHELESKPLESPLIAPNIIPCITPFKELSP